MAAIIVQLHSCSSRCLFCNPKGLKRKITKDIINEVERSCEAQAVDLKNRGVKSVEISGTDPIEYPKITSLIRRLKSDLGFEFVLLSTHGRNLCKLELVEELADAGLDKLRIPLYGSNAKIHDSITQSKGSFDETLKGIENVCEHTDMELFLTSLIMKQNYKDILNIFSLASGYSPEVGFAIPCVHELVDFENIAISFDKMRPHLMDLLKESDENDDIFLRINDIPYCVFGFEDERIQMTHPPVTAKTYKIRDEFKTEDPNTPSYRVKKQIEICPDCKCNKICDGFYKNYLDFIDPDYIRSLKPIS